MMFTSVRECCVLKQLLEKVLYYDERMTVKGARRRGRRDHLSNIAKTNEIFSKNYFTKAFFELEMPSHCAVIKLTVANPRLRCICN